jgi:hypothetical protein
MKANKQDFWDSGENVDLGGSGVNKGCQIFRDTRYQNVENISTKLPNDHTIYQVAIIYIYPMAIKSTKIFHFKALQNLRKLRSLV